MKNGIEIRWHGRGGQGAKTAALLLADVALKPETCTGFPGVRSGAYGRTDHCL